jgi:hypothetical protein
MGFFDLEQLVDPMSDYCQLLIVFSICCCFVAVLLLSGSFPQRENRKKTATTSEANRKQVKKTRQPGSEKNSK